MTPDQARAAKVVGYVPQRVEAELSYPVSAFDVVAMAATMDLPPWKPLDPARRDAILDALRLVGMADLAQRPIGRLSGGQVQRVMIARALAVKPRILLLDEPMVGIDVTGQKQFSELLDRLARELALTVVVVSHDLRTVAAGCDRVACLSQTLHCHVAPRGLTPQVLADVFRHDVAAIFGELHVDAHHADACADPSHAHTTPSAQTVVPLRIERAKPAEGSAP
jgi:zinc transport system ATP-binding protein